MKTYNQDPNFSIVMRGGCNASCSFCFNKNKKHEEDKTKVSDFEWLLNLREVLRFLPKQFYQISITGNEPMISPVIDEVMTICKIVKSRYPNILLTTNGTNLLKKIDIVSEGVHHINISRHDWDEKTNRDIFGGTYNVMDDELEEIIDQYSARGVDVSLNCVISDRTETQFIMEYIEFAKRIGAYAVRFRKQNGANLSMTPCEKEIDSKYPVLSKGECPVCRTWLRTIKGLDTYWKAAVIEPTDIVNDSIYEIVYDTDALTYLDWNRKHRLDFYNFVCDNQDDIPYWIPNKKHIDSRSGIKNSMPITDNCGNPISSSCGYSQTHHC